MSCAALAIFIRIWYNSDMIEYLVNILAQLVAVTIVLTLHEFAHAYAAYKCGDSTAKFAGRMSVNPLRHFDPLGLVAFAFVGFGWAKPVPINPNNFYNYRKGSFWTSIAGVLTNYLTAFLFYPMFIFAVHYLCPLVSGTYMALFIYVLFFDLFSCSLSFCAFNLIPLYPLDGFRAIEAAKKRHGKIYYFLRQYGQYILLGLMLVHLLADRIPYFVYIDLLEYLMLFAINVLGKPITLLWDYLLRFIIR